MTSLQQASRDVDSEAHYNQRLELEGVSAALVFHQSRHQRQEGHTENVLLLGLKTVSRLKSILNQ